MAERMMVSTGMLSRGLKANWGWTQCAKEWGYEDPENLKKVVKGIFDGEPGDFIRRLNQNEKIYQKRVNHTLKKFGKRNQIKESQPLPEDRVITAKKVEVELMSQKIEEVMMDQLKSREAELVDDICKIEAEIESLRRNKLSNDEKLLKLSSELKKLKSQMEKLQEDANEVLQNAIKVDCKIGELKISLNEDKAILEGVREEIRARHTVEIFAYENGEVDAGEVEIPSDWELIRENFVFKPELEEFTVKLIGTFAKVVALVFKLREEGKRYEVTFENELLQELFDKENNNAE